MQHLAGKAAATLGALVPVAMDAARSDRGATVTTSAPTVWQVLGYPFEAGSMIAALCACAAVRFYVVQQDRAEYRWSLDLPVSALSLMFAAGAVIQLRPGPVLALFLGTGFGALGAGIITIALKHVRRVTGGDAAPTDGGQS